MYVRVYVDEVIADTFSAVLIASAGVEQWVPRSQLHPEDNDICRDVCGVSVFMKKWIAEEKGFDFEFLD